MELNYLVYLSVSWCSHITDNTVLHIMNDNMIYLNVSRTAITDISIEHVLEFDTSALVFVVHSCIYLSDEVKRLAKRYDFKKLITRIR